MDDCVVVTYRLLKILQVKHTKQFLNYSILSHPDYPSLLSIADTLEKYRISAAAVKLSSDRLDELIAPFLVQLVDPKHPQERNAYQFYVVTDVSPTHVSCFDRNDNHQSMDREIFLGLWTGVTLLAEVGKSSGEPGFSETRRKQNFIKVLSALVLLCTLTWAMQALYPGNVAGSVGLLTMLYFLAKLFGLGVSTALLRYESGSYTPALQQFCSGGKRMSCEAVLHSRYGGVMGGTMSLSSLSFAYFFASAALLLGTAFAPGVFRFLGVMSLLTIPVVVGSLYFQARVIRRWCRLCLIVAGALITEVAVVLVGGYYGLPGSMSYVMVFGVLLFSTLLGWGLLRPLLDGNKKSQLYKRDLTKLKSDPAVLQGLLAKSRKVGADPTGLGILLKNETPKYHVLKVCNPYCEPCARAHPVLEQLYEAGAIDLQVIFTARPDGNDTKAAPVRHFMALAEKGAAREALHTWYTASQKDYEAFVCQYPLNGELNEQWSKLEAMHQWCEMENITHTPTVFINGYELPKQYSIEDLLEVLR